MSTPAQKANLARIRDNQRRSRARRREYIQELEQRLRTFELQGVEASAEVQMAARRVAEENRQLRELLNKHGFGDDYITRYLQMGNISPSEAGGSQRFAAAGDHGSSVQCLQHLIAPRRPAVLETSGVPFPLPSQVAREMSTPSVSSGSSSAWDPQHVGPAMPASYGHPQPIPVGPSYASSVFAEESQVPPPPRPGDSDHAFPAMSSPGSLLQEMPQQSGGGGSTQQSMAEEHRGSMSYSVPINPYSIPAHRDFSLHGPFY